MANFELSLAKVDDVDILVKHRIGMFCDMHPDLVKDVQASEGQTRRWIKEKMSDRTLVGFIVRTEDGQVAGSGCVWVKKEQPNPTHPRLEAPYLLSMYTEKGFRGRGVARLIVESAIAWSKQHGYDRISLHATDVGKKLYEKFGFTATNEMHLKL